MLWMLFLLRSYGVITLLDGGFVFGVEHHVRVPGIVVHVGIEFDLLAVLERIAHGRVLAEPIA